jgi:hypothetical protein
MAPAETEAAKAAVPVAASAPFTVMIAASFAMSVHFFGSPSKDVSLDRSYEAITQDISCNIKYCNIN